jgi:hypothetical protein
MKNDPISEIGIAITGIKVVRQFRRKMKMMRPPVPEGDEDGLFHFKDGLADADRGVERDIVA